MKTTLLIIFLLLSASSCTAQVPFLENTVWSSTVRFDENVEEFELSELKNVENSYFQLRFLPNNKFESYNIPGCGLDCVVHVFGNYKTTSNTIQFVTENIKKYKGCSGENNVKNDIGIFHWIKEKNGYRLIKNFDDEPKENYFRQLKLENIPSKNKETEELVFDYEYIYNRIYQIWVNKNYKKYTVVRRLEGVWWQKIASLNKDNDKEYVQYMWKLYDILQKMINDLEKK